MKRVPVLLVLLATVFVALPPNGALGTTTTKGGDAYARTASRRRYSGTRVRRVHGALWPV
jgi:hypothetical protein